MLRGRLTPTVFGVVVGFVLLAASSSAGEVSPGSTVSEIPLRGGLQSALAAVGDRTPGDRSQFLLEFIRRVHDAPLTLPKSQRSALLQALLAHVNGPNASSPPDMLPLPLAPAVWIDKVFAGKGDTGSLVTSILQSRTASLLYYGLLSLDDETRAWLAAEPEWIAELAAKHAAALVVVGPGFRVRNGAVQLPGGDAAEPVWRELAGQRPTEPVAFMRAVLTRSQSRLGYFFASLAQLTAPQIRFALDLEDPDPARRLAVAQQLLAVHDRLTAGWDVDARPFWRPALDPALLISDLSTATGVPSVPGTRALWTAALERSDELPGGAMSAADARAIAAGEPADFSWICEQIFRGGHVVVRRPYEMVLFASRVVRQVTPENAADALDAIRASGVYPSLVATLERANVTDVSAFSDVARRARQLGTIDDRVRAARALAQFQGSLVVLTRAALRRSIPPASLASVASSLSMVAPTGRGEYDGQLVRWWQSTVDAQVRGSGKPDSGPSNEPDVFALYDEDLGSLDVDMIRLLAGPPAVKPRLVAWEGTTYRLDLAGAEARRIGRLLGERPRPYLSSAAALVKIADALGASQLTRDGVLEQITLADRVGQSLAWPGLEKAVATLKRMAGDGTPSPQRLTPVRSTFRALADELFAQGLLDLVYAVSMGRPDRARVTAADAAARHDFGLRVYGHVGAWRFSSAAGDRGRDWHVTGSLLGLDVRMADLALARVSSRPPQRPTLNDADRRVFMDAVALVEPYALDDQDRDVIVGSIRKGRARLAEARTPEGLAALADELLMMGPRRTLLSWTAQQDPARLPAFLSPIELFWLGLEGRSVEPRWHAWGASVEARVGCLCVRLPDRGPLEILSGRWDTGIFATGIADLNLRLAELLAELQMPAPLLPSVLAAATLDLINGAFSRGHDDRRGLVEFIQAIQPDQVELYLALLTTDGPLVPVLEPSDPPVDGTGRFTEIYQ